MTLRLATAQAMCEIDPALGAGVRRWCVAGVDYLRHAPAPSTARETGCYPLVPFCNRLGEGVARLGDAAWPVRPSFGDPPMACHGDGWLSIWRVAEAAATTATLVLESGEAPWRYHSTLTAALSDAALSLTLTVVNHSAETMPFGLGLHPFFADAEGATVQFAADTVWLEGPDLVPAHAIQVPPELDHRVGQPVPPVRRNLCYSGWDGVARLTWPDGRRLTMTAPGARHLHLFRLPDQSFLCLEPQTHLSGAMGWRDGPAHGVQPLAPGQQLSLTMGLQVL
ncbi:MAG: hypothetical protein SF002_08605 [Alphaproteobacteria bacterium]|nr:hypothetical protein [Alphaproteobacteria bacterium]